MILFPAIDLKDGQVVRLKQGDYDQVTAYSASPLEQARAWKSQGTQWLHVVDLDAAKSGEATHFDIVTEIARETGLKVQVGGGIRSLETAEKYLKNGVARVIVGTQAVKDPDFLAKLGQSFPGQVALGLDTKAGKIAIQGWTETSNRDIRHFLREANLAGIAALIFTDIAKDGMMEGPNLPALREVADLSPIPVIASGGISKLEDLKALHEIQHANISGVIVGKALYEGTVDIASALKILNG